MLKTSAVFFPFDLFGSSGTRAGAELLADAFQEMIADNRRERIATRARAYTSKVRFQEVTLERLEDYTEWRDAAEKLVHAAWQRRDFLLWVTGNHLGALPLYDELSREEGGLVVQFDAHLDIYNLSDCTSELSHGNFLLHSRDGLPKVINVGHRELLLRPEYIREHYAECFAATDLAVDAAPALARVKAACSSARRILIDIDCDVLDPAYFPALSHPQPFGISPLLLLRFIDAAWSERVVGVSFSEFDPARDVRDQSLSTLIWLLEYFLLKRHE